MQSPDSTITAPHAPVNLSEKDIARFWSKVNKDGPTQPYMTNPCWIWMASKNRKGYGMIVVKRKTFKVHRVAWIITSGLIPHNGSAHGICVCHHCDNPSCVNPSHLFLGDHTDNMRDMTAKSRNAVHFGDKNGSRLHPASRPRGEAHYKAKLTSHEVIQIRELYTAGGITKREIAKRFRVHETLIRFIINRKIWAHI